MQRILPLILILLLSACSFQAKQANVYRQTHLGQDPKTFNPWIDSDATSAGYANLMYLGLVRADADTNEIVPELAKSFRVENGGKRVVVEMQKDLKWSDGSDLDAEDVVYTWNTLYRDNLAQSSMRDLLMVEGEFPKVIAQGKHRIVFETEQTFAPFLELIGTQIAPKHDIESFFERHLASGFEEKQKLFQSYLSIKTKPGEIVSSGAFKLSGIKFGERIDFEPNPFYYRAGLPKLHKITYSYVKDPTASVFKFFAGESHGISVSAVNAALIKSLESKYDYKLYEMGPSSGTNFIWFNLSNRVSEPKRSWFNDLNFRKAVIMLLIDSKLSIMFFKDKLVHCLQLNLSSHLS